MPESYTRQSAFSNGDVIDAPLFNAEFDQLVVAFDETTGHNHDGTVGAGAPIPFIQKENTGAYVDVSNPAEHKITFKIKGVVVSEITASKTDDTSRILHTPASGAPVVLKGYLDGLQVAVGNAAVDAAIATDAANKAVAAAMVLGVPVVLEDGETFDILPTMVQVDVICKGNATVNLPTTLTQGYRYSVRLSSTATATARVLIVNPTFNIVGDLLTVTAGNNLQLRPKEMVVLDVISATHLEII